MASITSLPPLALSEELMQGRHRPTNLDEELLSSSDGEEPLDIDQDDVQFIIQPALSPAATRLTSPKTPAAEKAAAMDLLPGGGLFDINEGIATPIPEPVPSPSNHDTQGHYTNPETIAASSRNRPSRGLSLGSLTPSVPQMYRLPSPWQAGPKELVVQNEPGLRPALSAFFGQNHSRRSSAGGVETLKKLRDALPSINLPSFFSVSPPVRSPDSPGKRYFVPGNGAVESKQPGSVANPAGSRISQHVNTRAFLDDSALPGGSWAMPSRSHPTASNRPYVLRRSTSDESMLYHSLSRVSSYGDDERWNDTREQKNNRLKAITDSWDRPTFKLPQMPSIPSMPSIPNILQRNPFLAPEASEIQVGRGPRPPIIPEVGPEIKDSNMSDLDQALQSLTGDIVIMGGYRGSILRSSETNRQLWVPVKVGLKIRQVDLEVGLSPEDEERMEESIFASGMLKNIGPVDISKRLFRRLRECENARTGRLRVWDYGYDWRLSPRLSSRKLLAFLEKLPSNQADVKPIDRGALLIAHSLGGLITRHVVNRRPELFSGVIYAGTPQRCINILGPFRNGDVVLFNEKVLTARVNFSLRTSFVFLPEDGFCFMNKNTGEEFPVDFYDPSQWVKYAWSPCVEQALPPYNPRPVSFGDSLREFSEKLQTPLRSRGNSAASESRPQSNSARNLVAEAVRKVKASNDRTLAPQIGTLQGDESTAQQQQEETYEQDDLSGNMAYLRRTLDDTKRFRAETMHDPQHTKSNAYPPLAVIYGKATPTVWAAHVTSREAIACQDAYDDLIFRSGDGVVLAREAMLPEGYELVKGGRVNTDRGHITLLGDLEAVGRALQAIGKGRRKGIGLGRNVIT